jgi:hypothetical protein
MITMGFWVALNSETNPNATASATIYLLKYYIALQEGSVTPESLAILAARHMDEE